MFKRQSKRFLSIVLSAAMLLTMAPAAAFAEDESNADVQTDADVASVTDASGTTTYYESLSEAVAAVAGSENKTGTVELLKTTSGGGIGLFAKQGHENVDLTIDFNGFIYDCNGQTVGSTGTES